MGILNPESPQPEIIAKQQIETSVSNSPNESNISHQKVETNAQKPPENKEPESNEDPNWRAFREARKKDRVDKEAAERRANEKEAEASALKAAMEAAFSKQAPTPQQQYYGINDSSEETEEQRIEKKVEAILAQKEQQFARQQQEREQREYPTRLNKDFPDFNKVCSQEALDYLDYHYPEVSRPLQRLNEGYDKWHDIYHAVKRLIPNQANARQDSIRAEVNSNKPHSISSPGTSPTGESPREGWQETERRRAENWARMQQVRKGV